MKALVISGGGSKGAFAGGIAQYLIDEKKNEYQLFLGTSTGSLLCPGLASGHIDTIQKAYFSTTQDRIFSNCPFHVKVNAKGIKTIGINHFNVLKNFLSGSRTFGESHHLLDFIYEIFTPQDYEKILHSDKDILVTVSNLSYIEWSTNRFENFRMKISVDGYGFRAIFFPL